MTVTDAKETSQRLAKHIGAFRSLFGEYKVEGTSWLEKLRRANQDPDFKAKRNQIVRSLLEQEGGKLSLTTILAVIGGLLGSIGIAGFGGAIGVPLAPMLAAAGFLFGTHLDAEGDTEGIVQKVLKFFANSKVNDRDNGPVSSPDDNLVSIFTIQMELADRYSKLEEENARTRGEIASCTNQMELLRADLQATGAEVDSLRRRNTYFAWGLLVVGLLALSELVWMFVR